MTESFDNLNNVEASIKSHLDFKERYSDLRPIGMGGRGAVFQVKDNKLDKLVAIKVLHGNVKPRSVIRFQKEARTLSKLNHRYIVGVLDFQSSPRGDLFLIMENVDGTDLEQLVAKSGPLPFEDVAKFSIQLCEALAHAHAHDVVHRDLKPDNIMIDAQKNVRILDFGIAKLLTKEDQAGTMTRIGAPIGSPAYMSPEQVRGDVTDERTDIFGLGLLIYIMAAGRSPFDGDQVLQYYQNMLGETVPSLRLWIGESEVAHKLDAIVAKAMKSDPNERFQTMAEMRTALDSLIADPVEILQVTAGPTDQSASSSKRYGLAAIILGVVLIGSIVAFIAFSQNGTSTAGSVATKTKQNAAQFPGSESASITSTAEPPKFRVATAFGLENVTFASASVTGEDLRSLGSAVRRLSLRELKLDPAMKAALPSLEVQMLDLTKTNIQDADLKLIAKIKKLNWLRLDGTRITSNGIKNLAPLRGKLQQLDLDNCTGIGDDAIRLIVDYFPTIRELQISDTSVKNAGIKELAKLSRVEVLWLSSLPVSDEDVRAFSKMNIVGLDISNNKMVTDESVKVLIPKARMRYLEITSCPLIHENVAAEWQRAHRHALLRGVIGDGTRPLAEDAFYPEPEALK